ncbi:TcfC E-set like domain-containing protein [Sphingomonas bacterium]|uniref:TcfC E-set like domain-containing protein n=1 Tax=Sphingomonas bacterium TaxID=1895847 RepID=UPI0015772C58|nr:TcfC E-set like domain-containing protein [Sphingomonas bacterium]
MNTSRPAGFDSLLQPQEAIADVVMGGRLLGQARVRYSPGKVTVLDVDALVALLPDLLDPAAIRAALAMPDLDSHPGMVCRANTDAERAACGIYHPAVAGVVFDDQRFRLDVYVHPGLLAVHPVATRGYLPRPQPGVSLVDRFGGSIAGSGGDAFYGLQNRAILAEGAARLRTDLSFSSYEGLTVDTLAAELDRPGVRYAAGALWVPGIELIGRRRLIGAGVASQVDTRLDRTSIAGTPLIVSLPLRARVDIIRDGRLLTSRNYEAGNQALDTTSLPDGSYEVVLHIEEIGGTAHDERRFFTKNVAIAAIGEPIFFAYGGLLGRNRRNAPFATSGTPLYLAGIARRFSPHLALDASVMGTDRTGLLELGGYHLGQAAQVRLAGLVSVHRDAGVLFQASSSGVARLNYTIDARRVWSHDDRPLIPLGEDGGDYGGIAVDRTAQLAAGSFTQVNATISYNLKPGQIGVTGSYRRDPRAGRSYAIGPTLYWPLVERAAVQVNLRGDMTVSNHGSSVFIGLTFQRVRARSSLTASLGARATSATSDNHDAAVIGAVGGSWHRPDVLGGDATLAGDVEREVSGTLVRGRADLAARHATLDVDVAQPIAGHDGATQYGINFQTMAAVTSSGIALQGRDQNDSILRVAVQGAPRGAPFEILVDNAARGIVHAGTETSIAVAPYRQYAVRIRSVGGDIIQFDGNTRLVSVYPGNVGRLVWSARRVVAMFGRAVWADGTPVADAAVYVAGAIGGTDGDGYFQIEAGSDDVLKIQSPDGRTCRLPLSARPAALGYAALGTLTCPRPSPPMQFAVSKP